MVKRYVDDIFICAFREKDARCLESSARTAAPELKFTTEHPENGVLQLHLRIHVEQALCWDYGKKSAKPVLSRKSCHTESVKAGVVKSLVMTALRKSCTHFMGNAVKEQWLRLESAGYEEEFTKRQLEIKLQTGHQEKEKDSSNPLFPRHFPQPKGLRQKSSE